MALPFLGFASYIGIGTEITWGTAVTRTRWMRPTGGGLTRNVANEVQPDLSAEIDSLAPIFNFQSNETSGGTLEGYFAYNDYVCSSLLYHALGGNTDAGAGPYTHTMVPAKTLPVGLTIEQGSKDFAQVFEGCKVNSLEINWEVGKVATMTAEIICETAGAQTTVASPTFIVPTFSLHNQVGTLSWNALTSTMKKFKFKINNNLSTRQQLGALFTAEPYRSAPMEIMLEVEQEKTALTHNVGFLARTQSNAVVTISAGASASLAITVHNALIETYDDKVSDVGPVLERMSFRGFRDTTNKGLSIVLTNANATTI